MKRRILLALLVCASVLVSCAAPAPHPMDMNLAVQNAKTRADHAALSAHYGAVASEMTAKAEEHKTLITHYEKDRYLYPKQWPSMGEHCLNLVRFYEGAAQENKNMEKSHRAIADSMQ